MNLLHRLRIKAPETNAHWFAFFRSIADQLVFGAPVIVYAKSLGASSIVLGVIASLAPLTSVLQIPAAKYMEERSYSSFALTAGKTRIAISILIALIPLISFWENPGKLWTLIVLLLLMNLTRIPVATAWLPWVTAIIPIERRGRFLSINQLYFVAGSLVLLITAGTIMIGPATSKEYSIVFAISTIGVIAARHFLRRVPPAVREPSVQSPHAVPWLAMLSYRPFLKLLGFNMLWVGTLGSLDVFRIEFLRDQIHYSATELLFITSFSFVGAMIALPLTSRIIDRVGSRPMLKTSSILYISALTTWCLIAANVIPCFAWLSIFLFIMTGAAWAIFSVSCSQILIGTVPQMGRSHFFALYSVIIGIGTGVTPIIWGFILDALTNYELTMWIFHWKRHSIYFLGLLILNLLAYINIRRFSELSNTQSNSR
jgi:MFS family permease